MRLGSCRSLRPPYADHKSLTGGRPRGTGADVQRQTFELYRCDRNQLPVRRTGRDRAGGRAAPVSRHPAAAARGRQGCYCAPPPEAIAYLLGLAVAFEMSLGMYGYSYPILYHHMPLFEGLRAPARLGFTCCSSSRSSAAYGQSALEQACRTAGIRRFGGVRRCSRRCDFFRPAARGPGGAPAPGPVPQRSAAAVCVAGTQPLGVVAEMPIAPAFLLPGDDPRYAYMSTFHWMPSINGYSGYYPPSYLDRVQRLQAFPAAPTTEVLRRVGVRYVIVHPRHTARVTAGAVLSRSSLNQDYVQLGSFNDGLGHCGRLPSSLMPGGWHPRC